MGHRLQPPREATCHEIGKEEGEQDQWRGRDDDEDEGGGAKEQDDRLQELLGSGVEPLRQENDNACRLSIGCPDRRLGKGCLLLCLRAGDVRLHGDNLAAESSRAEPAPIRCCYLDDIAPRRSTEWLPAPDTGEHP